MVTKIVIMDAVDPKNYKAGARFGERSGRASKDEGVGNLGFRPRNFPQVVKQITACLHKVTKLGKLIGENTTKSTTGATTTRTILHSPSAASSGSRRL